MSSTPENERGVQLGDAAREAGSIVTDQIHATVERAQRQAEEIRQAAESDAETKRHAAEDAARSVLERIYELEQPLGELVLKLQHEMDKLAGVIEGMDTPAPATPEAAEPAAAEPAQAEPTPAEPAEAEPVAAEPAEAEVATTKPAATERAATEPASAEPAAAEPGSTPSRPKRAKKPRRKLFGRGRARVFITEPGTCAVCHREFAAGTEEALELSGWRVSDDVGVCPSCQEDGWQLPPGARLPFRRGDA